MNIIPGWVRNYQKAWLSGDMVAGVIVTVMLIPQSLAYAMLAGLPPGEAPQAVCCEGISEGTRRLLDTLMPKPASIQKPNFDIVAWNDAFCRLMGVDFSLIPEDERNCIMEFSEDIAKEYDCKTSMELSLCETIASSYYSMIK